MVTKGIWVMLEAKPGKEKEVEAFLKSAQPMVEQEAETVAWFALKIGPTSYGIFDAFADDKGRDAHMSGKIAEALKAKAPELFAHAPKIDKPEILAAKIPGQSAGMRKSA